MWTLNGDCKPTDAIATIILQQQLNKITPKFLTNIKYLIHICNIYTTTLTCILCPLLIVNRRTIMYMHVLVGKLYHAVMFLHFLSFAVLEPSGSRHDSSVMCTYTCMCSVNNHLESDTSYINPCYNRTCTGFTPSSVAPSTVALQHKHANANNKKHPWP